MLRAGLLLGNLLVTIKLFAPLAPLLVFLTLGYALVLHTSLARAGGARDRTGVALVLWTVVWLLVRPGESGLTGCLASLPSLGLDRIAPLVGASYVYLKVFDLIRRAQRGEAPPTLSTYLLQMTFAPAFLAGPIAGPAAFAGQLALDRQSIGLGLRRVLGGVFKLLVLAQLVAPYALLLAPDACALMEEAGFARAWVGTYASALWVWLNFAGYSDLAIGAGLVMGVRLPENFAAPYLAASPSEFWQRWHLSFTAWLREHVFTPLSRALAGSGGAAGGALALATVGTMIACALWHGFTLALLAWGVYHGLVLVAHQVWAARLRPRLAWEGFFRGPGYRVLATLATFHLVALGWALFLPLQAPIGDHLAIVRRLSSPW